MSEMIARVAKRIQEYKFVVPGRDEKLHIEPAHAMELADVMIQAMKQPTRGMEKAGAGAVSHFSDGEAQLVWNVMIDEALR